MTVDPCRSGPDRRPAPDLAAGPAPDLAAASVPGREVLLLDQPFGRDSLYVLRAAVAAHATRTGLRPDRVDDLVVAAHELAANVILHGRGQGQVRLWLTGAALRCEIADGEFAGTNHSGSIRAERADLPGAADLPRTAGLPGCAGDPAPAAALPWPIEHGHGLWLVSMVADEVSLRVSAQGSLAAASFALGAPVKGDPAARSPN